MNKDKPTATKPKQLWEDVYLQEQQHLNPEDESSSSYFFQGPSDRSSQYVPGRGFARYYPALRDVVLVRKKKKNQNNVGVEESGAWSFFTYSWLTKYMIKAFKKGLDVEDVPDPSPQDTCEFNVQRIENLWQEELIKEGPQSASLKVVTWRFVKTRVIFSISILCLCLVLGFINVAYFMRYLLEFAEDFEASKWSGLKWVFLITISEMLRLLLYSIVWAMNVRTGIRLRTAFQGMLYRKILRVHSLGGKSIGELINLFSNDGQRIFDLIILAPMVMAGPLCMILGMTYVYTILGPWPVLGLCTMILFYPLQYLLSYLSGYLKRKVFSITDERITVISEVLNGIKFIKLYAWTKIYISKISEIRKRELGLLTKISYCNSFALALASNAPVMSAIITCVIHIIVEGNITASQAFTILMLYLNLMKRIVNFTHEGFRSFVDFKKTANRFKAFPIMSFLFTTMRLYILYLQWGLTNIVEISIICKRFKEVMLLNESTIPLSRPLDKSQAVCIADGCFARYLNIDQLKLLKLHKRRKTLTLRRATVTAEEIEKDLLNQPPPTSNYAEILFDINFFAPKGSLIGICGPVGSGKTTLLSGILGHLCMTKGKLCREGTCAYVSQQPWLINATVRENVLFGEKFFARKYYNAIHSCDLEKDIDSLPGGDNTEVGERGVNLSGGQKQRIALARAVYSDRQIYLLDDPLSAVDAQVAIRIFEECVLKILYAKTVLLVSNQMQFLNHCNEIVVMKEGRIIERGNPHDLLARDSEYKIMMEVFTARNEELENITLCNNETKNMNVTGEAVQNHVSNSGNRSSRKGLDGVLIREEKTLHGKLRSNTFFSYVHACGGFVMFFLLLLVMFLNVGSSAFSSWWLHIWIDTGSGTSSISSKGIDNFTITESTTVSYETSAFTTDGNFETTTDYLNESSTFIDQLNTTEPTSVINASNIVLQNLNNTKISGIMDNPHYSYYLTVYCCSIAAIFLTNLLRGLVFTKVTLRASSFIHKKLVERLMKTYMLFFETTPVGRVQNLFSKDIDEVETRLPYTLEGLIQGIWNIAFSTLFVCLAYPIFIGPVIVVCILYAFVDRIFRAGLRDLKRLDNTTRSPILSNVSVTVQGLDSIHAFEKEKSFVSRFNASYDLNTTCSYMCNIAQRWLALRVDGLAVLILLVTSLLVVFMHGSVSASLAGLALTYATTFAGLLQYTIRLFSDNEVKMISVERINSYHQYMEEEGGTGPKGVPKETWPELGSIRFKNVELKYREELDPSLKGVSFHVRSEEKIGIIGRTGAGKSSIISALFRLVEISKGVITIDNLDIAGLELTELRKRMSVIPQDPVLLSGTVRFNLDPKNEHLDEAIWAVLEKTGLKPRISQSEEKLNMKLSFNDDSLSTGEKQLLCIARALLKNTKVLVLDEATSSLDHEIEATIRKIIFDEMKHCTTIIIAHRLDTIKGCNRVLVMEDGTVLEYDEPATLLQNSESRFYKMVNATFHGDRSYQ